MRAAVRGAVQVQRVRRASKPACEPGARLLFGREVAQQR